MRRWSAFESARLSDVKKWLDATEQQVVDMKLEGMSSATCDGEVWVTVIISYIEMPEVTA